MFYLFLQCLWAGYLLSVILFWFHVYFVSVKHSWTYEQKDEGNQIILSSLCFTKMKYVVPWLIATLSSSRHFNQFIIYYLLHVISTSSSYTIRIVFPLFLPQMSSLQPFTANPGTLCAPPSTLFAGNCVQTDGSQQEGGKAAQVRHQSGIYLVAIMHLKRI